MLRRIWPVLFLALLPLIPLHRAVFLGEAIGPFDQIRQMQPWNGPKPSMPWDVLQADGVLQFYPWRKMVFDSWGNGQLPLWNNYELAGTPLLANSQSAGFYPPHVLMGLLHVPVAAAMTFLAWLHLFWAGLGVYWLARKLGATLEGGAVAGGSFSLSAFMLAWTGLPSVITTCAWIPWVLGSIVWIFASHPYTAASQATLHEPTSESELESAHTHFIRAMRIRRSHTLATICLALSVAMMLLAGHLQFAAYGLLAAAALVFWLMVSSKSAYSGDRPSVLTITPGKEPVEERGSRKGSFIAAIHPSFGSTWRCLLALSLGFCMAAPQLLPVLRYSEFSHRRGAPTEDGYQSYVSQAIAPFELVGIVYPGLLGAPTAYTVPADESSERIPSFWPAYAKRGDNFAEAAIGLGPVVVMLLFCLGSLRGRWRQAIGLVVVGTLGFLLAVGSSLDRFLYFYAPGWSASGSPGRASVLFVLAACTLAGLAVTRVERREGPIGNRLVPLMGLILVSIVSMYVLKFGLSGLQPLFPIDLPKVIADSTRMPIASTVLTLFVVCCFGGYWLATRQPLALVVALLVVPLMSMPQLIRSSESSDLTIQNPPSARIAVINSDWELLLPAPAVLPPNTASLSGIHELGGYDSLLHSDTVQMLKDIDSPKEPAPPANGNMMFVKPSADPAKLAQAGVEEVWSAKELPAFGQPFSEEGGLFRYRLTGPGRASTPQGPAKIVRETFTQIRLEATGPGKLTLRDRNMPGWLAKVDRQHVPVGGTLWREVDLPAGTHTVEFNYVPPGFMTGVMLGVPAWLLVGLGGLLALLKKPVKTA